jgi:hybrid cluster-associated redox disulfide protein
MRHPDIDDPDLSLDDLMTLWPATIAVFLRHKMLCIGCMVNPFHTVMDACREYDLEEAAFRKELHSAIEA